MAKLSKEEKRKAKELAKKEKLEKKKAKKLAKQAKNKKAEPVKKESVKKAEPAKKEPVKKAEPAKKETVKKAAPKKEEAPKKEAVRTYHVVKRADGKWEVKFAGGQKAIKLFATQKEAIEYSKVMAENQGGSMLVHNSKGANKGRIKKK